MYVHSEFSDKYFYRRLDVTCIYLSEMPTRNTLVVKKSWPRSEKRLWWNQKRVSKAYAGMLLITLKILVMMIQATKHWGKKYVLQPASSLSKFLHDNIIIAPSKLPTYLLYSFVALCDYTSLIYSVIQPYIRTYIQLVE